MVTVHFDADIVGVLGTLRSTFHMVICPPKPQVIKDDITAVDLDHPLSCNLKYTRIVRSSHSTEAILQNARL